ncbi:MAG TPA: ATP synthase subunit I [Acidimicrobiia bacterium]|nr:ATP synthase subunit I [Acidimicrobiia bacterium]
MAAQEPVVPLVEREVALDIVKRGVMVTPLVLLVAAVRGWDGVASAAIALGIVLVNFLAAAAIMTRAAKSGPTAIGAAALGGYVLRLAVILVALVVLRHQPWIDLPTLGFVIVGTHLGLLVWEMKYVSLTLAAPGLKPARPSGDQ